MDEIEEIKVPEIFAFKLEANKLIKEHRNNQGLKTPQNRVDLGDLKMIILALDRMGFGVVTRKSIESLQNSLKESKAEVEIWKKEAKSLKKSGLSFKEGYEKLKERVKELEEKIQKHKEQIPMLQGIELSNFRMYIAKQSISQQFAHEFDKYFNDYLDQE